MATPDPAAVATARTMLFVPGHREDRIAKARGLPVDAVVLDLEDGVPHDLKARAREAMVRAVSGHTEDRPPVVVRLNGAGTHWHRDDVETLDHADPDGQTVAMIPKVESPGDLLPSQDAGSHRLVLPLIESAKGLIALPDLCRSTRVLRLAVGTLDLANDLGVDPDDPVALRHARCKAVLHSAAAGLPAPLDGVTATLGEAATLARDLVEARRLGFGGRLCIHPDQVAATREAFAPSADQLRWAREVLSGAGEPGSGATRMGWRPDM